MIGESLKSKSRKEFSEMALRITIYTFQIKQGANFKIMEILQKNVSIPLALPEISFFFLLDFSLISVIKY